MIKLPKIEEKILRFWQREQIFAKSIKQRKNRPIFSFYDGPPFASGLPHYGHILATTIKDAVLRYWTMRGYQVPRRVGWDCHGLPVENLIEKELGLKSKKDVEKLGIENFNRACRAAVFRCTNEWVKTLRRVGRWADYSNAYTTMDNDYIESVWWVFKQLWDKGLVYQGYRVTPYCSRCGTPLSNFEVNQGYKEVEDLSIYIKFPLQDKEKTFFLVWTTTPWTLPANVTLAVHPQEDYLEVETKNNEHLILAQKRLTVLVQDYKIIRQFKGKDLVGLLYQPLYQFSRLEKPAHRVIEAEFVSMEEGTGIVHIAPAFGEEDMEAGKKNDLPILLNVDLEGRFIKEVKPWAGLFVKEADPKIIQDLKQRDLLYQEEKIRHTYPFCWRCDNPLLYYALNSWYVAVTKIKKQLVKNNQKIHWVPRYIKEGRFGKWLEGAKDWAVSRSRFWGAPIPIWECEKCGQRLCIGSIKDLIRHTKSENRKPQIKDLHRPYIDRIKLKCRCGAQMKRVPEVFDCWFESGSMPYAQWHYPFENKKLVEKTFPADFIAEGLDQTRGWFYTLHVLATALTLSDRKEKQGRTIGLVRNQPAFKNVIVNGLILDDQGRKLSKKLGNYPEPSKIFNLYGADALRYFLLASTPMGEDYRFSEKKVAETWRRVISTLWNIYLFFETYAIHSPKYEIRNTRYEIRILDRWIVSRLHELNQQVVKLMNEYELTKAARLFDDFIDDLSNWYVRRSRRRFQRPENEQDKRMASMVLGYVLSSLVKLMAPFTPFITEEIYRKLKLDRLASVHLCDYPKPNRRLIDLSLNEQMQLVRQMVAEALAQRAKAGIKVRQPLEQLTINNKQLAANRELANLIQEEVNVKKIVFGQEIKLETKITPKLKEEGMIRDLIRQIQEMRKDAGLKPKHQIYLRYSTVPVLRKVMNKWQAHIQKEISASQIEASTKRKEVFLAEKEIELDGKRMWLGIKKVTRNP
jgi:isoleucyl-tRNA synthetase